jgi:phenylalanyl-tRNA synthetase beta chain
MGPDPKTEIYKNKNTKMLISHNWLKKYFTEDGTSDGASLPNIKTIENTFTMGIFEVEEVKTAVSGDLSDTIFDIKVLPDRAHYCYSHRYVAQELGALLNIKAKLPVYDPEKISSQVDETNQNLAVAVNVAGEKVGLENTGDENARFVCPRYMARLVENVEAGSSPVWLKNQLEVLGQRSINTLVDLTNYIMLETGQPLHAFDADKVEGAINVRFAKEGEIIILLDGTEVKLSTDILIIADDKGALAIAGVKGGKKVEVTSETKRIIIESANFDSVSVRKTSQKVGIKNEASKRYENKVTPERTALAMNAISEFLASVFPGAKFGKITDIYLGKPSEDTKKFDVSVDFINNAIGLTEKIDANKIIEILARCDIKAESKGDNVSGEKVPNGSSAEKKLTVFVPSYRLDLEIGYDIVDEVGRLLNYMNLVPVELSQENNRPILKNYYYTNAFRMVFKQLGFSEVYTHSLKESGDIEILNPLNIERGFMRNTIGESLMKNLEHNLRFADLLGIDSVKVYETGSIFGGKKERLSIAFGIANSKKVKGYDFEAEAEKIFEQIMASEFFANVAVTDATKLDIELLKSSAKFTEANVGTGGVNVVGNVCEIDLQKVIDALPIPMNDTSFETPKIIKYKKYSQYPFMSRDISVFVPGEADQADLVKSIIVKNGTGLLSSIRLFDIYTKNKEGEPIKTSYALRLVFQSDDRTLTDDEITAIMQSIMDEMNGREGWEVR